MAACPSVGAVEWQYEPERGAQRAPAHETGHGERLQGGLRRLGELPFIIHETVPAVQHYSNA